MFVFSSLRSYSYPFRATKASEWVLRKKHMLLLGEAMNTHLTVLSTRAQRKKDLGLSETQPRCTFPASLTAEYREQSISGLTGEGKENWDQTALRAR